MRPGIGFLSNRSDAEVTRETIWNIKMSNMGEPLFRFQRSLGRIVRDRLA
jgi:hypothetical protein